MMKSRMLHLFVIGVLIGLVGCSGGKGSFPYRGVRGANPWWEYRDHYYDRAVAVPHDGDGGSEAIPLPEPSPDVPAIGMPDKWLNPKFQAPNSK